MVKKARVEAGQGMDDLLRRHPQRHKKGLRRGMGMVDSEYVKFSDVDAQNVLVPQEIELEGDYKNFKIFPINGLYLGMKGAGKQDLGEKKVKEVIEEIKATPNALVFIGGNLLHLNENRKRFIEVNGDWYPIELYDRFIALTKEHYSTNEKTIEPRQILKKAKSYHEAEEAEQDLIDKILDDMSSKLKETLANNEIEEEVEKELEKELEDLDFESLSEDEKKYYEEKREQIHEQKSKNKSEEFLKKVSKLMFQWQGKYFTPEQKKLIKILNQIPQEKIGFILRGRQERYLRETLVLDLYLDCLRKAGLDDLYVGDSVVPTIKNKDNNKAKIYFTNGSAETIISTSSNKKKEGGKLSKMEKFLDYEFPEVDAAYFVGDLSHIKKAKTHFVKDNGNVLSHNQRFYALSDYVSFKGEGKTMKNNKIVIPDLSVVKVHKLFWDKGSKKPYFEERDFSKILSKNTKKNKSR